MTRYSRPASILISFTAFQMKDPHNYQLGTTALAPEQQTLLMEVMRIAEEGSAPQAA